MSKPLNVTELGDFIRHRSCERRVKLAGSDAEALRLELPFFERLSTQTLDPVLQEAGRRRENSWEESLIERGFEVLVTLEESEEAEGKRGTPFSEFRARCATLEPGQDAYGREIGIFAQVGDYPLQGRIDFALLLWRQGRPVLRLVECKASRRDRTYHRIQVACYRKMVRAMLAEAPCIVGGIALDPADVEVCVARIEAETNESQDMLALEPLDEETLAVLEADIEQVLAADGPFRRIAAAHLESLDYQLDERCNDCFFAVHCFTESARMRKLELLGLAPSQVKALKAAGVENLDELAELDPESPEAIEVRKTPGMALDPGVLAKKAKVRLATLPGAPEKSYEVESIRSRDLSTLPEHGAGPERLIRVYLAVDYDYSENRIGAVSAHITRSDGELYTGFKKTATGHEPDPELKERRPVAVAEGEPRKYDTRELRGSKNSRDVVEIIPSPWTGDFAADSLAEQKLLEDFFSKLLQSIEEVARMPRAPIHFYVWEKTDISRLIDACLRLDGQSRSLLAPLRSLLGARGHAEQVIYSSLAEEMQRRFAIGYTGRGLMVAASMSWFGQRYHWVRSLGGEKLSLDWEFGQDIFDFRSRLNLDADGGWALDKESASEVHTFEVRGRFSQSLTAPYWRAYWKTLPDPKRERGTAAIEAMNPHMRKALERYNDAARGPSKLKTFLNARVHALRWLEERMTPKNKGIEKPAVDLAELRRFSLEVEGLAGAAVDFLRLDHHVKLSDWTTSHLTSPAGRIALGQSLPLVDVEMVDGMIEATLAPARYDRTLADLEAISSLGEGSFVRLTPCFDDSNRAQTNAMLVKAGKTCSIESVDWVRGVIRLSPMRSTPGFYMLPSYVDKDDTTIFEFATIDESPSDFVAGTVEKRLLEQPDHPICTWLDPTSPAVPAQTLLEPGLAAKLAELAAAHFLPSGLPGVSPRALAPDQQQAALEGLESRIQLLQGPPGCLAGSTMIDLSRAGKSFRMPLADVVHRFNGNAIQWAKSRDQIRKNKQGRKWRADIPTLVRARLSDGSIRLAPLKRAWPSGKKRTYILTTATGRFIRATEEHPFLAQRGWLELGDLRCGDRVCVGGGKPSSNGVRAKKPNYRSVEGLKGHPHAGRKQSGRYSVPVHRLTVEAEMNALPVEEYIRRLRKCESDGLVFLDPNAVVHHRDRDQLNNARGNLEVVDSQSEHASTHGREGGWQRVVAREAWEEIVSIECFGEEETYDLELELEPHNFLANGFVVHNTGKTQTTAVAVLLRILVRREPGDVVCIAANTHTAVDTLLERIDAVQVEFAAAAAELGLQMPEITLAKVNPRQLPKGRIQAVDAKKSTSWMNEKRAGSVVVLAGTTNAMIKIANTLDEAAGFQPDGFRCQTLVIDEASMMVFPHLLALATSLDSEGELMLAGDHRQLSPIVAHNWEREDRAPVVTYTPFASAYDAILGLATSGHLPPESCRRSALHFTFRLPPEIRKLLDPVYRKDGITLGGRSHGAGSSVTPLRDGQGSFADLWAAGGVFLVLHSERSSQQANELEAKLIEQVLAAAPGVLEPGSVGVVTPHRAQRALLKTRLERFFGFEGAPVDVIDTVERLQGGERDTIFASACASDPAAIASRAEFLLDLNRANVAFSRPKERLVVVVSEALLDHIPHDLDLYDSALLWKSLRGLCSEQVCERELDGHRVRVFAAPQASAAAAELGEAA